MTDRYVINGDVVKDTHTGLEWQAKHFGPMTWRQATEFADKLGDGWRLPTVEELERLLDRNRSDPASVFPGMPSKWFWSSSSFADFTSHAWGVYFRYGYVSSSAKTNKFLVRCVRGGSVVPRNEEDTHER